jgi:hypothetical protein
MTRWRACQPLPALESLIPDVVRWTILFAGVITVGFTCLFGFHDFRMHVVMTMAVAASLALVVVVMVALGLALSWRGQHFSGCVSRNPEAVGRFAVQRPGGPNRRCSSSGSEKVAWNRSENSVVQ